MNASFAFAPTAPEAERWHPLHGHVENDGQLVFGQACQFGFEGIVAKRADSVYRSGHRTG